jgi:hypothetical protein
MSDRSIRIISVPPGDAPLWVREKWVGLELSIVGSNSRRVFTVSVNEKATVWYHLKAALSGRSKTVTGYQVEAGRAVDILATSNAEAAEWWRKNTPELLGAGRHFVFHAEACQLTEA